MLDVTVQTVGATTILRCRGRIVTGDESRILREEVLAQAGKNTLIIDLGHVDVIDAGGLGLLLELRHWARSNRLQLRLLNIRTRVQQVFAATNLSQLLEVDLLEEKNGQLHNTAGTAA